MSGTIQARGGISWKACQSHVWRASACLYQHDLDSQRGQPIHGFAEKGRGCTLISQPEQLAEWTRPEHYKSVVGEPYGARAVLVAVSVAGAERSRRHSRWSR
jgi:hypothetical protein